MAYDVEAARAERVAQRTREPFTFTLAGETWTMVSPDDTPATFLSWSVADYARNFSTLVITEDADGKGRPFPVHLLTTGDMNALVAAWIGGTPGESSAPSSS